MGTQLALPEREQSPRQFSAHVYSGQTAGWIKMPLGIEVDLDPGHIVLDGDSAPPPTKGHNPTQFSAHICCGQMAGWIKMALGTEVDLSPVHIVLDGDPASPPAKEVTAAPPSFRPMSIVATVAHLSYC